MLNCVLDMCSLGKRISSRLAEFQNLHSAWPGLFSRSPAGSERKTTNYIDFYYPML